MADRLGDAARGALARALAANLPDTAVVTHLGTLADGNLQISDAPEPAHLRPGQLRVQGPDQIGAVLPFQEWLLDLALDRGGRFPVAQGDQIALTSAQSGSVRHFTALAPQGDRSYTAGNPIVCREIIE